MPCGEKALGSTRFCSQALTDNHNSSVEKLGLAGSRCSLGRLRSAEPGDTFDDCIGKVDLL